MPKKQKDKLNLKVVTIGKPDIDALSESEKQVFYSTLLDRIIECAEKEKNQDNKAEDAFTPDNN